MTVLGIYGGRNYPDRAFVELVATEMPRGIRIAVPTLPGAHQWFEEQIKLLSPGSRPVVIAIPKATREMSKEEFQDAARVRNQRLVDASDVFVLFLEGAHDGTAWGIFRCLMQGTRPFFVFNGVPPREIAEAQIKTLYRTLQAMSHNNAESTKSATTTARR